MTYDKRYKIMQEQKTYTHDEALKASIEYFAGDELAATVFITKYALRDDSGVLLELTPTDMHRRLAREFARIETKYPNPMGEDEIFCLLDKFRYVVPQGSPMSAIGNSTQIQSLSNCFVIASPRDSYGSIARADENVAQIQKRRGGVGLDISNIRPKTVRVMNAAGTSDGIGIFMERYSNTTREVAQCLHGDTQILTINGLKSIRDVKCGDEVWTSVGWVPVDDVLKNKKSLVEVTTKHGRRVMCSLDHVFHTPDGEKPLCDLVVGDSITQIVGTGWQGQPVKLIHNDYERKGENNSSRLHKHLKFPVVLDTKLAYLVGQMYGDGCIEKKDDVASAISIALSEDWSGILDKVVTYVSDVFGYESEPKKQGNDRAFRYRLSSREIIKFLADNGILKQKTHDIVFPDMLLSAPTNVVFAFIAGFFDADGCVQTKRKQYKMTSVNRKFLEQTQHILSAHGVVSKISADDKSKQNVNWSVCYSLTVNGGKSQSIFASLMNESVKIQKLKLPSRKCDWTRTISRVRDLGLKSHDVNYLINNEQFVSYQTYDRLIEDNLIENKPIYLLQDSIVKIETVFHGLEQEVFDLVLPREHLFFANGLYLHNSGRRGALMITIDGRHPDVETFINIKQDKTKVTGANVSVRVTDDFMKAVENEEQYTLRWPVTASIKDAKFTKTILAKDLWQKMMKAAWSSAEPGILYWDTVKRFSMADEFADKGFETICTNPCAELVLSKADSCRLLLLNLFSYVKQPFKSDAYFDFVLFAEHVVKAQRLMDDLVDLELEAIDRILEKIKNDPEPESEKTRELALWKDIQEACYNGRRTGTGITALGDAIAALGQTYGGTDSIETTETIYRMLALNAHASSVTMAKERGAFPAWELGRYQENTFAKRLMEHSFKSVNDDFVNFGRRNIALTTTAPAGSVSTLTQTTSGIEPAFLLHYKRRKKLVQTEIDNGATIDFVDQSGDKWQEYDVYHHGYKLWLDANPDKKQEDSPYHKATSNDIDWIASVDLLAAAQRWTEHSISKTINLPATATEELVSDVYMKAWKLGIKGVTVYRDGCRSGVLVAAEENQKQASQLSSEVINSRHAPKRPKELPCDIQRATVKGEKYLVLVGLMNGAPYELFAGLSDKLEVPKKFEQGKLIKNGKNKNGLSVYNFSINLEDDDQLVVKDIATMFDNAAYATFTRMISLSLRHGVPVQFVCEQMSKSTDEDMQSFAKVISRVLKKYIPDGAQPSSDKKCLSCGSNSLTYQQGCVTCLSCGSSKCG